MISVMIFLGIVYAIATFIFLATNINKYLTLAKQVRVGTYKAIRPGYEFLTYTKKVNEEVHFALMSQRKYAIKMAPVWPLYILLELKDNISRADRTLEELHNKKVKKEVAEALKYYEENHGIR